MLSSIDAGARRRSVIVGGTPIVRDALRAVCAQAGLDVVGDTGDPDEATDVARRSGAEVAVVDVGAPLEDGVEAIASLMAARPGARILVLVDLDDPAAALACLRAGALGCLERAAPVPEVRLALAAVAEGRAVVGDGHRRSVLGQLGELAGRARAKAEARERLTPREREILALIAQGLTSKQVAGALHVSPLTVETHVAHLYRKLRVRSRVQAVRRAAELGLLGPPLGRPDERDGGETVGTAVR